MLMGLIVGLISMFKFKARLKQCLVIENVDNVTLFEYKGKAYDRDKFIKLEAEHLYERGLDRKTLQKHLAEYESELINSKEPELTAAQIEAYQIVLSKM